MIDANVWKGRRVLVTGHMGFKGSWLTALLDRFGARTVGFGRDVVRIRCSTGNSASTGTTASWPTSTKPTGWPRP